MLWLYRLLFLPTLLVLAPAYWRRMRRRGGYGAKFGQRFGFHPRLPAKTRPRIWLQAVSVGEVLAIGPILQGLRADGADAAGEEAVEAVAAVNNCCRRAPMLRPSLRARRRAAEARRPVSCPSPQAVAAAGVAEAALAAARGPFSSPGLTW